MTYASLTRRLAKLEAELDRQALLDDAHCGKLLVTTLPGVANWPAFANRTYIQTGDERGNLIVPFLPYDYQVEAWRLIMEAMKIVFLKSRQLGFTDFIANYLLCRALTERGFVGVIISQTQAKSSEIARRVKAMAESIQGEHLEWESRDTTSRLAWKGRGVLHFLPATAGAGRGIPACAVLFIDEGAFIDLVEEIMRGAGPSLSKLGTAAKIIVNSTPDVESNWYGRLWCKGLPRNWYDFIKARDLPGLNALLATVNDGWTRYAVHYSQHPEYGKDPDWAERTRREFKYTQATWNSEFELMFGATGNAIYSSELVTACAIGEFEECAFINRTYVLGVDPNGTGDDSFVAIVLDVTAKPNKVVAMYRADNRSTPYSLKQIDTLIQYFDIYNIVIERNSMGVVIAEQLALNHTECVVETIFSTREVKNALTDRLVLLMEDNDLIFPEGVIAEEMGAFTRKPNGRREASTGYQDDTVMALALAATKAPSMLDFTSFLRAL